MNVLPTSFLTLHYRLGLSDEPASTVIDTFAGKPATLQLGAGQLAEPLEQCLLGLAEGERRSFDLEPSAAFGPRNPELIQKVARSMLVAHSETGEQYVPGDLVEFPRPDGGRYTGVLKELNDQYAVFDFNHPLAGRRIRFEVEILGVL